MEIKAYDVDEINVLLPARTGLFLYFPAGIILRRISRIRLRPQSIGKIPGSLDIHGKFFKLLKYLMGGANRHKPVINPHPFGGHIAGESGDGSDTEDNV